MADSRKNEFVTVTETPGVKVSQEQLSRLYARYRFALDFCKDKDVLEVACGAGQGLGYLAKVARRIVGGDIDEKNLDFARKHYAGKNIELRVLDAHKLPFEDGTFDVIILYEAIYYLSRPEDFLKETYRVLRKNGVVIICTVNNEWSGFNPSPYSVRYYSAQELRSMLKDNGFRDASLFGDCPVKEDTLKDKVIAVIKRMAVSLHLMPKTMKGKEFLKRVFFGKLQTLPEEICDNITPYTEPAALGDNSNNGRYKVIFAVASKP